jgi:hypothetical protein
MCYRKNLTTKVCRCKGSNAPPHEFNPPEFSRWRTNQFRGGEWHRPATLCLAWKLLGGLKVIYGLFHFEKLKTAREKKSRAVWF